MSTKLTVKGCEAKKKSGRYGDGGGLYLKVSPTGTKSWIFRFRDRNTGKQSYMGLGAYPDFSLKDARDTASEQRKLLATDLDPLVERNRLKKLHTLESTPTFDQCTTQYITIHKVEWTNKKHIQQWENTLKTYASPIIGKLPIDQVSRDHILEILTPIWLSKTETASRLRQRIECIFGYATVKGWYQFTNPALWRHNLDKLLASPEKIKQVKHHKSLPYESIKEFIDALSEVKGLSSSCLKFTILTACRTNESIGARWEEIDFGKELWTIPKERMKSKKKHVVPLSSAALEIIQSQQNNGSVYLFPGIKKDRHLSSASMMKIIKTMEADATTHGFRSTFRNWAAEQTNFPREICESALAHSNRDKTESAYLHSDHLIKRTALMSQWATFCVSNLSSDNVVFTEYL